MKSSSKRYSIHFWSLKVYPKLVQSISIFFSSNSPKFLKFMLLSWNHLPSQDFWEVCWRETVSSLFWRGNGFGVQRSCDFYPVRNGATGRICFSDFRLMYFLDPPHSLLLFSCKVMSNPMDCGTPGFPVLQHLPGFDQINVHWVSDAIQPSYPPLPPFLPALHLSKHHGLF